MNHGEGISVHEASGRVTLTRSAYERLRRHDYAGRRDGAHWVMLWTDRGTTLFTRVTVEGV